MKNLEDKKMSRRAVLKSVVAIAGLASVPLVQVKDAEAKVPKAAMHYRDHPNGKHECSNCMQFLPGPKPGAPGKCRVVAGSISPHGWCVAYTAKS